jgi:hypothetical protein
MNAPATSIRLPFALDTRAVGSRSFGHYLGHCRECARQFMSDSAPCVTPSVPVGHPSTGRFCSEKCLKSYYSDLGFQSEIDYMTKFMSFLRPGDERRAPVEASIAAHVECEAARTA